ncbi:hypothetical protein AAE478_009234 [Parahypoxylon ruwenzoriense]
MHAFTYLILSFIGVAHSLPTFLAERRGLINLSPDLDLGLNFSNDNSCLGIGISVCDPITVDSTKNSTATDNTPKSKAKKEPNNNSASGDNSLINLSPDISSDLNISNDNSCLGIGISACDPITVGSDVTNTANNNNDDDDDNNNDDNADEGSNDTTSTYPTSKEKTDESSSSDSSSNGNSDSNGGGLVNSSPEVSPDLNLSNDNSCQGIGVSACDPITVDSKVENSS